MYLDNAATTRVIKEVGQVAAPFAHDNFYNASAIYEKGLESKKALDNVRDIIKKQLRVTGGDVVFTSGATESNNLAILGSVRNKKEKYIFSAGEHPSVYYVAKRLEELGQEVVFVGLTKFGSVDLSKLEAVLDENVRLISIIHVSNETGAINDLKAISKLKEKKCKDAFLHVDGSQAFCKIQTNLAGLAVDYYSMSGHKIHATKGVGALYIKNKAKLKNINYGGGQEYGLRSGTEPVPAIVGFGHAVSISSVETALPMVQVVHDRAVEILKADGVKIQCMDSDMQTHSPYIVSASFLGVNGETLVHACSAKEIYISRGSACSSKQVGNRVLEAVGIGKNDIASSVRISFNRLDNLGEVLVAIKEIVATYKEILWKLKKQ